MWWWPRLPSLCKHVCCFSPCPNTAKYLTAAELAAQRPPWISLSLARLGEGWVYSRSLVRTCTCIDLAWLRIELGFTVLKPFLTFIAHVATYLIIWKSTPSQYCVSKCIYIVQYVHMLGKGVYPIYNILWGCHGSKDISLIRYLSRLLHEYGVLMRCTWMYTYIPLALTQHCIIDIINLAELVHYSGCADV